MMIPRLLKPQIELGLPLGKAVIVIGPRQVGKTTLVRDITKTSQGKVMWLTGDDPAVRKTLDNISLQSLKNLLQGQKTLVIDEAQRINNIGLTLKLITDQMPEIQLFVTGSSALDIASKTKESLTGRKFEYTLFPISFKEMVDHHGIFAERSLLEDRLLFGYYPEILNASAFFKEQLLTDLSDGIMYKDLLVLDQIKKPGLLVKLLQALALQIGQEVSYREVGQLIDADLATVEKYIGLLEQSFVLFSLPSLSRNARNEIKKGRKIYFYDNGIRNAILKNFSPLALRQDTGALWENFLISERKKHLAYANQSANTYFWRNSFQQEIDYIEDKNGVLKTFEFKWSSKKMPKLPKTFSESYPQSTFEVINQNNFEAFLGIGM
jgi:uncharacterized protein